MRQHEGGWVWMHRHGGTKAGLGWTSALKDARARLPQGRRP